MIDREKVIKGLECCIVQTDEFPPLCEECPYRDEKIGSCEYYREILSDALALLKAQELTDRQLEDTAYENKKAYDSGYVKGFHDAKTLEEYLVEFGVKIGFLTPKKAEQLLKEHLRAHEQREATPWTE